MYGQELTQAPRPRRSLEEIYQDASTESDVLPPKVSKPSGSQVKAPRKSLAEIAGLKPYGPEISASDLGGASSQPSANRSSAATYDTYQPKRPSSSRGVEAARVARQINDLKDQSVALFQQADKEPGFAVDGGLSVGQQLRAQAEGKLEQANRLAKNAQRKYANELEVGFGEDADKKSGRQWAYAKVKPNAVDAKVEEDRLRLRAHDSQMMKALDVSPEDAHRLEVQRQREEVESEWLPTRWARRFVTAAAGGLNPDEEVINQPVGRVDEAINSALGSATRGMYSIPEGAARLADNFLNKNDLALARVYEDIARDPARSPEKRAEAQAQLSRIYANLSKMGDRLEGVSQYGEEAARNLYPVDPSKATTVNPLKADFWSRTLPEAGGSMLPFIASAQLGAAAGLPAELVAGGAGAAMEVPGQYKEAKAAGATPQQLARAIDTGAVAGALESVGAESLIGKLPGKGTIGRVAKEALQEGVQEGAQQFVENVGAKYYSGYAPNRALSKDVWENAVPALFLGAGGGASAHVAEKGQARSLVRDIQNERASMPGIVPTAAPGATGIFTKEELASAAQRLNTPQSSPAAAPPAQSPVSAVTANAPSVASAALPQADLSPVQPIAPLFPEAQVQPAQIPNLANLSPQDRAVAMLDQIRQQRQGRVTASAEQQINKEFVEAAGLVNAAAQSWDADRVSAELLATTGAQRLKASLQTLQKSEPYQAELAAVATGASPGPYLAAAQSIQQRLNQAESLFQLDAQREAQQRELEKQQKKAQKEAAKQSKFAEREQMKLDRKLQIEQQREQAQAKRDAATAVRMEKARAAQESRRQQLERQRTQARNEKARKSAENELQQMQMHSAALQAADTAGRRHQEYLNQGLIAEAINELTVQQNQLRDAVRYLARTPESQNIKADLNRFQGQIGNRIGDLRKQQRGQKVPVTQAVPPLFRPDAVSNPEGGTPPVQSFYEPGAMFDRAVPTIGDVEEDSTPMLTAIRRAGGIANDSISPGELRRLGVKESGTTGLVNNRGGLAPDRMREAMVEAGYLPEDSTVDDLFQAIEGEMRSGRSARPAGSIGEFFDQWQAEASPETESEAVGNQLPATDNRPPQRKTIADYARESDEGDSWVKRAAATSDEVMKYGSDADIRSMRAGVFEPGVGLVSFSPYDELERRNVEPERALYDNEPTSEAFNDAIDWITEDAAKAGIEQRHVDAMVAYALNWHGEKAFWEGQGLSMDTVQQAIKSVDDKRAEVLADAERLPKPQRDEVVREVTALDTFFDDLETEREVYAIERIFSDAEIVNLLEQAAQGDNNAFNEFNRIADEYGISAETVGEIVRARRPVRSTKTSPANAATGGTRRGSPESEKNAGGEPSRGSSRQPRQPTQRERQLLKIRPSEVFDKDFDAYMTEVEDLYRRAVQGEVDIDPKTIYDFTKWTGVSAEDIDELRAAGENAGPLAKIRGNRHKRVEENRLPARQNVEIINEYKNADLDRLAIPSREGRKSQLDQVIQATSVTLDKNPSGVSSAWMAEVRKLHERAIAARERYQSRERDAKTVTHSNPAIDGKPVLAETADGRVVVANPDNQAGVSIVKPQSPRETIKPTSERGQLAQAVAAHLADGKGFANIVEARKFIAEQTGREVKPGSLETKQVDEAIEAGAVLAARQIVADGKSPEATFQAIRELYDRLPNLSARTSTSIKQQAYSTPLPLAYVASELAGISSQTTVYEPSAGHSALLLAAEPSKIIANELNAERAATVRDLLPGATVTEHNAAEWKPDQKVDRVIANPPFGIVKDEAGNTLRFEIDRKYQTSEIDHAIAFEALKAMKDDGKAVLIVGAPRADSDAGRSNAYNAGAKRSFYFTLYNQYNVTDHFTVLGDLYQKQGAGSPVDVIVIEGRGRSQRALPAADVPATLRSWDEVGEKLASRSGQNETVAADNVRLGERGLSASERDSSASRRTVADADVYGVPARSSSGDDRTVGNAQRVEPAVSNKPTGRSGATGRASEPARPKRGAKPANLQQQPVAGAAEQPGRVSGANDTESGQSAREAVDRGNQPGTVGQRADAGTGRASFVGGVFDEEFAKLFGDAVPGGEKPYTRKQFDADVRALNKEVQDYKRSLRDESASQPTVGQPPRTAKEAAKSSADAIFDEELNDLFGDEPAPQSATAQPSEEALRQVNLLRPYDNGSWQYKFAPDARWMTANSKESAIEEAIKAYNTHFQPESGQRVAQANLFGEEPAKTPIVELQPSALTLEYRQIFDQTIGRYVDTYKTADLHAQFNHVMDNDAALAALAEYLKEKRPDLADKVDSIYGALTAEAPEETRSVVSKLGGEGHAGTKQKPNSERVSELRDKLLTAETLDVLLDLMEENNGFLDTLKQSDRVWLLEAADIRGKELTQKDKPKRASGQHTTRKVAQSAAKETVAGLDDIAKGLLDLFGDPNRLGSGPVFDEESYAKAKPLFEAAVAHFKNATTDVREVIRRLLTHLKEVYNATKTELERMKPYILRFVQDFQTQAQGKDTSKQDQTKLQAKPSQEIAEADSDTHRAYKPASSSYSVGTLVPVNMANAVDNSLRRLKEEVGDLDDYVADRLGYKPDEIGKYLSGEQVDAVAMAIRNIEQGGALILGDQTGIGKGRVVAAVIRYANRQKLTPVFVTEKPTLYGDMIRDLTDIGSENLKPLITNAGENVPLDDEALEWYGAAEKAKLLGWPAPAKRGKFLQTQAGKTHEAALRQIAETGNLGGHHVIFTTYNQMQSVQGRLSARHDLLRRFANNGIVIFDESHNAGGAGQVEMDEKGKPQFNRAQFAREMAKNAKGVLYSSATFAKRPEVMDLYFRTELGKAVGDLGELAEITQKGGVPMQQVIASMLAESGQYIRRERSFKGVEYAPTPTKVDRTTAESVSKAMREVAAFDRIKQAALKTLNERVKAEAKRITVDGSVGQAGVSSVNFTSLMHNLIEQSLLALKADQAAETAIRALEAGEKPVITVANTMGSFIQRFAEDNELQPGAPINLSFNDLLNRYLERSREVVIGKPYGEKTRHYLSDEELGEEGVRAYKQAAKTLERLNLDIPISPIDWLHKRLRDAGYRTGEITGRGHIVNYTSDGATYATRPASETSTAAKKRTIAAFNDGTMDVLILNQSGSTGISLHASEKFKDQRRRHMIIAQAEKNIDTHMQMLGRVHRTGQVVPPRYTQMVADIPAELRPAAVLAKKMASLNANTTASRSSAVTAKDVPDFLNKYGDEVAASLMESNPELHEALGYPLKDSERSEGLEREDAMRKVTGRVPLLTIAEQERVYQELTDEYEDALRQAEAMGENALEAKTLNLDAETLKTQPLVAGSGSSLFEQAANLERVSVNRQGKPFTSDEVMEKLKASLGDAGDLAKLAAEGRMGIHEMRRRLSREVDAFKLKMEEEHGDSKRGQLEQLAADKWLNRWRQITGVVYPGATVSIANGYGVVLSVERKGKRANPVALSGWRATVALADSRRQMTVALSKIDFNESEGGTNRIVVRPAQSATVYDPAKDDFVRLPILEAFNKGLATTKENRYMVTGNLIAGFGAAPNGQIVNFTNNEGGIRQGILMPSSFDPAETIAKQKQRLKTVDEVMTAVNGGRGAQVTDRTGDLTISKGIDGYVFSVPAAKGRGGKYYLNSALLKAAGMDFAKRGSFMEVQVDGAGARQMVDALLRGDGLPSGVSLQTKAPRVAERRGDAAFTGRYTVSDLATNATAEYRPARNRPGTVYLNEWGHALVRDSLVTVFGESVSGIPGDFTLDSQSARHTADAMRERAGGAFTGIAAELDTAADDADANGRDVAIVTKRAGQAIGEIKQAVRHETTHTAQSAVDQTLTGAATEAWLAKQPKAQKIKAELARRGYADKTHGYEAVAYIASGDFSIFGLSLDEAVQVMNSYYRATVQKYGARSLEKFGAIDPKLQPVLEGARNETQTADTIAKGSAEVAGRGNRGAESQAGRGSGGVADSSSGGRRQAEGVPRVAERKERRFSFGELASEPTGTVLGSVFGGLQSLRSEPKPKTSPLREILSEHKPLTIDPYKIQDMAMDELLNAGGRGVAGSLPGARALYWAKKLRLKPVADRLANRQADFIADTLAKTNDLIQAHEAMQTAKSGSKDYETAKRQFDRSRLKIADALAKAGEYTTLAGYTAKTYKSSLLSAPHIHLFNVLEQLFKMPLHEAQRVADVIVPASVLNKFGIPYSRAVTDFRDLVPAVEAELRGLGTGLRNAPRDVLDMFRYGITQGMIEADDAEAGHAGGTDKFELGHRAKLIPGLDQVLNFIGRSHGAADILFSNMVNATAISAQANAMARKIGKENGLTGEEIKGLARDLAYRPSALMVTLADDATMRFKLDYPTLAYDALQKLRDLPNSVLGKASEKGVGKAVDATWKAAMDFVVPFSKIPLAAVDTYLFRYSPVAFGRVAGRMAMAKGGEYAGRYKGEFARQRFGEDTAELLRQGLVGSLSWALLGALGSFGYLAFTGGSEDDKDRPNLKNAREVMRVGYGPEVGAGDYAFNLNRMGPIGQAAGIATRIYEAQKSRTNPKTGEPEETSKRIGRTVTAAKEGLLFNNPLGQAAKDIAGDDTHSTSAGQYVAGKLRGFVPGAARDIAKIQSPTKRMPDEASTLGRLKGDLQSGMPVDIGFGSRAQMVERLDALGQPIEETNPFAFWRKIQRNPQLEEMIRLGTGLPKPKRNAGESATEYNKRLAEQAETVKATLRRIASDTAQSGRSDAAKARIYSTELATDAMKRAAKLSEGSIETERELEALRADTYETLRQMPAYQKMKESGREAVRELVDEQLKAYRARAASSRTSKKTGKVSVVRERAARAADASASEIAGWAIQQAQR